MQLNATDLMDLFTGSSFFSCGGGVPLSVSTDIVQTMFNDCIVEIKDFNQFLPQELFCTAYAIGASGDGRKTYPPLISAINALQSHVGTQFSGFIPGEVGSEINVVWTAVKMQIPIVDTDMVGGRAVPEDQMDIFGIHGIDTAPLAIANSQGDTLVICKSSSGHLIEKVCRGLAEASDGWCYVAGRPLTNSEAAELLPTGTMSRALHIGKRLNVCTTADQVSNFLYDACKSQLLAVGRICGIVPTNSAGFISGVVSIQGLDGFRDRIFKLFFKNETLAILEDDICLCSVPDLISIIDRMTLKPLHNSCLSENLDILVYGTPALPIWRTERGVAICGPQSFGFDFIFSPLPV